MLVSACAFLGYCCMRPTALFDKFCVQRNNHIQVLPILQEGIQGPAPHLLHDGQIDPSAKKLRSAPNLKRMACDYGETCCLPYAIAFLQQPLLGKATPLTILSKGKEWPFSRWVIGCQVRVQDCNWVTRPVLLQYQNRVSTRPGCFCPGEVE